MASTFRSYVGKELGNTPTTIFTATKSTTIIGFSLANITTTPISASAQLYKYGADAAYIVKDAPIPSGGSLIVVGGDQKIVLEIGDFIVTTSNTLFSMDSVISTLEIS